MARPDLILMGRASGAFGLKGEIRVFSHGRDPEVFRRAGRVYLGPNPEAARPLTLVSLREHGGRLLLTTREVSDRTQAQAQAGAWVYLERAALKPLDQDEYYWYQLKGALVVDKEGRELGRVVQVGDLGAHDLLLVRAEDGKEALIPVVEGVVLTVDPLAGLVRVDPPPGLLEAQGWPEDPEGPEGKAP
ncbi:MAG: 16S rRNA processing protein RimM [Desulfarculus sp.]|nr:16S rRNA processing protein RimM [Desulfarculus sp.]